MKKAKFWLIQIVMVAFVSVALGSPVLAHGNWGHKRGHKKDTEKIHKMLERKITKQDRKIDNYEGKIKKLSNRDQNKRWVKKRMKRLERKQGWAEKKRDWYQKMLDRHNAKHHESETPVVEEEIIVADTGGDTGGVDPVAAAQAACIELFGAAASFSSSTFMCTNIDTFEEVQL